MSDKDKPWTADDIRTNATNWSLQCDGKLLEYMQNLSKTIQDRGNRTTYNLHTSMLELDRTKITLENATNQLMALQHKQFIENRVYDDDETIASVENVPTTDSKHIEEPKPSVIEALQNAIDTGMQMVDKYFDKVTLELSDSEDDDGEIQNNIVFRPKNLYEHRPLPYLIGSKEWHEKWHIGLIDEESEGSDNESSVLLSSSSAESISSNIPVSPSEAEHPNVIPSKKTNELKLSDSEDLFQSSSDENLSRSLHEPVDNSTAYHKQGSERSKIATNVKQADSKEFKMNNSIFMPQKPIATSHTIPTLINSDPPELDDLPTIKNIQKPANLFIDDENDVDDFNILNDKNAKGATQTTQYKNESIQKAINTPSQTKSINLFADDDGENFDSFLPIKSTSSIPVTPTKVKNLFEDDDDFDDELFLQPSEQRSAQKLPESILSNTPKKSVFLCNLFSDEPPEDDFDVIASSSPKPSTSKDADQISKIIASPDKFTSVSSAAESQPKKSTDLFSNKINWFGDEEEEDPFEKLIANTEKDASDQNKSRKNLLDSVPSKIDPKDDQDEAPITIQSSKKSDIFNPVNWFTDNTFDDDEVFSNITSPKDEPKEKTGDISKQNTGEFYNDFSNTVTILKLSKESEVNSLNSEKKSTSPSELKKVSIGEIDGSTSSKLSSGLLKKIDVFSNPISNDKNEETTTDARQPKKLNITNIDINVNALLPGAKRTQPSRKSDDLNKDSVGDANIDVSDTTIISSVNVNEDNIDSSGRLVNLNRNRPKNISRRPSTRAGRKQQYQKSLEDGKHSHRSTDSIDYVDNIPEIKDSIPTAQTFVPIIEDDNTSEANIISTKPLDGKIASRSRIASVEKKLLETNSMPEGIVVTPKEENALNESDILKKKAVVCVETVEQSMASENKNSFSFLDVEENDDFLDFQSPVLPKLNENNASFVKATPAYIDELPPELDFAEEVSQNNKSNNATSYLSENALSLFDDEDDYDNGIFSTENQKQTPSDTATKLKDKWSPDSPNSNVPTPSSVKKIADKVQSLSDDSLIEDDLFNSPITTTIKSESNKKQQTTNALSSSTVTKQNIFGDNDDDDDLFGGPTAIIEQMKKVQPKKSASKIFSDDSSDDDLFGGKITKKNQSKPATVTGTTSLKTQKNNKSSDRLFSDSEDDHDDLFGTKVKPPISSKPVKEDTQKSVKLLSTNTVENDPLADLLK